MVFTLLKRRDFAPDLYTGPHEAFFYLSVRTHLFKPTHNGSKSSPMSIQVLARKGWA